jgi:predicted transcriptional regulator
MPAKATTFRIEPPVQAALEMLSKILKRPMNQLVNEAVKDYVSRRSEQVEHDLEATLAALRAYRERDPDFETAIAGVAEAEARFADDDPAQGRLVKGKLVEGGLVEETGPLQKEIDRLLHG